MFSIAYNEDKKRDNNKDDNTMRITITGKIGSGKSTVAKEIAKKLGYKYYSVGMLMGELALKRGISLMELSKIAEKDTEVDFYLDKRQKQIGRENNLVMDSRLGFHFIPDSFKIFLDVQLDESAKRVFQDRKNRADEKFSSLQNAKNQVNAREESEKKRYKEYYKIDPYDLKHYDLVVDTTSIPANEVVEKILKEFGKVKE